jgi:hypothetical protein
VTELEERTNYPNNHFFLKDEWVKLNEALWNCKGERINLQTEKAQLETVIYFRKGKTLQPFLNAYNPVRFTPSVIDRSFRIQRQWFDICSSLIRLLNKKKVKELTLTPDIMDVRPFLWSGYLVRPAYTFTFDFKKEFNFSKAVKKQIRKCQEQNFVVKCDYDIDCLLTSLKSTEERQKVHHQLSKEKIEKALELIGKDQLLIYNCYNPAGEVLSSRAVLFNEKGFSLDWLAGTVSKFLSTGCTQFLINAVLNDLKSRGSPGFDFCGANTPSIQAAKSEFGGDLTVYYVISKKDSYDLLRERVKGLKSRIDLIKNKTAKMIKRTTGLSLKK